MTTFHDLLIEVIQRESCLLSDTRHGEAQQRRIIVQRADGAIWEAWDTCGTGYEAQQWTLPAMEHAYLHAATTFAPWVELDGEALYRAVSYLQAMDEVAVLLGQGAVK